MKSIITSLLFLLAFFAQAQNDYFQQEVNSTIHVTLDDNNHTLSGDIEIQYTNHSPQTLHRIYMHLWPNGYSSRKTAFAKQEIEGNFNRFYFAKEEDLGNISDIDFQVDGLKVKWNPIHPDTPDIAILILNEPLRPNKTISIQTPFKVKIPASFSRLGHVKTSYQITQWYPKPAVFDRKGWHPIPYLNMGEFYSEFGDFDVTITLPENYVVGATGTLQTPSEKDFLAKKVAETKSILDSMYLDNEFPASAKKTKTIQYKAENVHDFAWFADKRFLVTYDTLQLPSGKIIDTWAMFPPEGAKNWAQATDYLKRSVESYSKWVGEYPYPQATAVQSALSAGGGMEYPMITVIGRTGSKKTTDDVITHEVGHNWFYGILASNEREHPWMDEGMNTFYENRYMDEFYPKTGKKKGTIGEQQLLFFLFSRSKMAAALNDPIESLSEMNYGLTAYAKPALSLKMLEAFVGRPTYDRTMQAYYKSWKFKHPYPEDFKAIWTKNTDKNLDWFFDDILNTTKTMDYKPLNINHKGDNYKIKITNKGALKGPLLLYGIQDYKVVDSMFLDGFTGTQTIEFPKPKDGSKYDAIEIDRHHQTLDLNPKNNNSYRIPLKPKFGFGLENNYKNYLFYTPIYGWNEYDKAMLGMVFFNEGILNQSLFYSLIPMYSFGSKSIVGTAEIQYPFYTDGTIKRITPNINVKRFSYYQNLRADYSQIYTRVVPSIKFEFRNKKIKQKIKLSQEIIQSNQPVFKNGEFKHLDKIINQYTTLQYALDKRNAIQYHHIYIGLEYSQYDNFDLGKKQYTKLTTQHFSSFAYQSGKHVRIGFHGAYFLQNDARYSSSFNNGLVMGSLSTSGTGRDDYAFRSLLFGRNQNSGIWSQQISSGDAGVKHPVLNGPYGHSNDWMFGFNIASDLPVRLPKGMALRPYFDVAFYGAPKDSTSTQAKKMYSGGIQFSLGNVVLINFPIFNNKELNTLLKQRKDGSYLGRITFQIAFGQFSSPRKVQELILNNL